MRIADAFWWSVVALGAVGLLTLRSWWPPARVLVLGIPASWFVMHVLMVTSARHHAPETPSLALLAAQAVLAVLGRRRRFELRAPTE